MTATAGTNLDRTLHLWWTETPALQSLVDDDYVISGEWQDEDVPSSYVTINTTSEPSINTNSGVQHLGIIEIACRSATFENAKAMAVTVREAWNRTTRNDGELAITSMRYTESNHEQDEDGFWSFTVMFEAKYRELL